MQLASVTDRYMLFHPVFLCSYMVMLVVRQKESIEESRDNVMLRSITVGKDLYAVHPCHHYMYRLWLQVRR